MTDVINFKDFINEVAENSGYSRKDTEAILKSSFQTEIDMLKAGKKIRIVGFKTVEGVERPESTGRNPQTGETITIRAKKKVKVKVGKAVDDAINA